MLAFAFDENLNHDIVRALYRRNPGFNGIDITRAGLGSAPDETVLEWAATQNRVLVTHDVSTITAHVFVRLERGLRMPGVIEIPRSVPLKAAISDLLLIAECAIEEDLNGQILYLPLR